MSKSINKKIMNVKKAALSCVNKFDKDYDPLDDSPVALWALAEALGIQVAMTSCPDHYGHAISTTIGAFLKGADLGMELKEELNQTDEEMGITAH